MEQLREIRGIQIIQLTDPGTNFFDEAHRIFIDTLANFIKNNKLRHPITSTDLGTDRAGGFRLLDLLAM